MWWTPEAQQDHTSPPSPRAPGRSDGALHPVASWRQHIYLTVSQVPPAPSSSQPYADSPVIEFNPDGSVANALHKGQDPTLDTSYTTVRPVVDADGNLVLVTAHHLLGYSGDLSHQLFPPVSPGVSAADTFLGGLAVDSRGTIYVGDNSGNLLALSSAVGQSTPTPITTSVRPPTLTDTPSITDTPLVTDTPIVTATPSTTDTPIVTDTPSVTDTPIVTDTPSPISTAIGATATVTATPTTTPTSNCLFITEAAQKVAKYYEAIAYLTSDPDSSIASSFVTLKQPYPKHAYLLVVQPNLTVSVSQIDARLVMGQYRFAFSDGPLGITALLFALPPNAKAGTVHVRSTAHEACGTIYSSTPFTVSPWSSQLHVTAAQQFAGAHTLVFPLPSGSKLADAIPASPAKSVYRTASGHGSRISHSLVLKVKSLLNS